MTHGTLEAGGGFLFEVSGEGGPVGAKEGGQEGAAPGGSQGPVRPERREPVHRGSSGLQEDDGTQTGQGHRARF